jgi:hypothetical protein
MHPAVRRVRFLVQVGRLPDAGHLHICEAFVWPLERDVVSRHPPSDKHPLA